MQVAMGGSSRCHFAIAALVLICLHRKVEAQSIVVRATPRNLIVFQGNNIELFCYCTPGSTPVSSLKWLHNGVVIASRTTCSGTPFTHQLWNVDFNDEGVYTCRMELSDGTVVERNFSGPLNVVDPARIQAPAQQYALLHSNTTLNCTTTFSETSSIYITWMKNDTNHVSNQIINVELIHEGNYMCEVYLGHLFLVMKKNVEFYVIVPPIITSHSPSFHEITGNQPFTLTVEFQSRFHENTTVTWYQNGSILPEGRVQTQYSSKLDGRTTLQFDPITRNDKGVYGVVVRNSFGIIPLQMRENETSFQVSIIVPPAVPSNVSMSNTTSSQVQVTWSLTHQHADERAESLTLTVLFSNGTISQQYQLEGNVTQQVVDTVPGMEYQVTVSVFNQDGTNTTDPVSFQTPPGQPSISSIEVTRLNRTTFNLSVSLAYTGGGAITHFKVSSRNTGTTPWTPLEDIPATPSPNSSLVWNGVVSRDEFAAYYQVEFLLSVINQDGFESNSTQAEIDLATSHQTTAPTHPTGTGNLKTVLLAILVPACAVFLLLLVGAVIAVVYGRRRRRRRKIKKRTVAVRPIDRAKISSTNRDETGAVDPQSVKLVELLPRRMIIPSGILQVLNTIGQGEFGSVFKAHLKWHRSAETNVVAVKTMKGVVTSNDIHKLEEEVLKMVSFKHPNVMTLIGVCENLSGGPAIIMPYMANGSVLDYLRRERRNLVLHARAKESMISSAQTILLGMCLQIAKGMEYLADQKIVHRDLAARNCMIDADGVIKVADFGLAEDVYTTNYYRWKKGDTNLKLPVRWMSPESAQDGIFTEKSDVWSFGVTCWEVFSGGMIPYGGISPMALLHLLYNGERLSKPPNSACTNRIYFLLLQCWDGQPEQRPNFSQLLVTISTMLEVIGGYLVLSATDEGNFLDTHPFKYNSVTLV